MEKMTDVEIYDEKLSHTVIFTQLRIPFIKFNYKTSQVFWSQGQQSKSINQG